MQISIDSISEEGNAYQRFLDGIRDPETKRRYNGSLRMFLDEIPDSIYHEILG